MRIRIYASLHALNTRNYTYSQTDISQDFNNFVYTIKVSSNDCFPFCLRMVKILPAKEHVYHFLKLIAAYLSSVLDVVLGNGRKAGSYEINGEIG